MISYTPTQLIQFSVLILIVTTASACMIQPFEADCPGKSSCDSCMDSPGCGWCSADEDDLYVSAYGEGRCLAGTSFGPADRDACRLTHWFYAADCFDPVCDNSCSFANDGTCDEPDTCDRGTDCTDCHGSESEEELQCSMSTDCDSCMSNPAGCGWCSEDGGRCQMGDSDGPLGASCDSESWHRWTCPSENTIGCVDSCRYARDGECDEPTYCDYGTDCTDCR
jgi:hypothetical protein